MRREPGRSNTALSYMWVFRGSGDRPILYYRYAPTRSPNEIKELLKDYKGDIDSATSFANLSVNHLNENDNDLKEVTLPGLVMA